MTELPNEAEALLAVGPERFVAERKELAKRLRDEGRREEAEAVAGLRKPSAVVFAVNRAARDRPKAAQAAADAAVRLRDAQVAGDADAFAGAAAELDTSLDMLAEVALAHAGERPSEATRRRLRELLRSAVADDEARDRLVRGTLTDEIEATGFGAYAGVAIAPPRREKATKGPSERERAKQEEAERRERRKQLRAELADAERKLREARSAVRAAEQAQTRAEKAVEALRSELEDLESSS